MKGEKSTDLGESSRSKPTLATSRPSTTSSIAPNDTIMLCFPLKEREEKKRRRRERWERGLTFRYVVVSEDGLQSQDGALR